MDVDDELPPWLGQSFRDAFHAIFHNQHQAEQHAAPAAPKEPSHEHRD